MLKQSMKQHYQYLVIGGGSGGVASARRAAKYGASTLLIESKAMGGTCVNVGCVPKKVMWYASDMASKLKLAYDYGFKNTKNLDLEFDWPTFKAKRDAYVHRLNGIYERNLTKEGVDYIYGFARFNKDGKIEVIKKDDNSILTFTADNVLIATGGKSVIPKDIPGYEYGIDSDGFFKLSKQPKTVAIVGGGYIGVELAGVFNGLGSKVHMILRGNSILTKFDSMIKEIVEETYEKNCIDIIKKVKVIKIEKLLNGEKKVYLSNNNFIIVDELIWTIGRKSLLGIGTENIGLELNERGQVIVDEYQRSNVPNVYSLGDVVGNLELTPVAIATGRKLSNRLFGPEIYKDLKQDYTLVPTAIFSHPEAGSIGLTEIEAIEKYGQYDVKIYKSRFNGMFYAMSDHKYPTSYKLICIKSLNEKIVGLHLVGDSSAEILQGFGVAIKMGATKEDFDSCVAIHPTSAEELVTLV
jgi:glutathione reductase (NADPH)